jgi:hypothetical protein
MQPVDDPERRLHNTHPQWEVPIDVIEQQPSYTQAVRCCILCRPHAFCSGSAWVLWHPAQSFLSGLGFSTIQTSSCFDLASPIQGWPLTCLFVSTN